MVVFLTALFSLSRGTFMWSMFWKMRNVMHWIGAGALTEMSTRVAMASSVRNVVTVSVADYRLSERLKMSH